MKSIRSTWGRPLIPKVETKLAFLLGSTENAELLEEIERENSAYHDLVQGDFVDTYHNLSYKSIMGKLWVSEYCQQVGLSHIRAFVIDEGSGGAGGENR